MGSGSLQGFAVKELVLYIVFCYVLESQYYWYTMLDIE